MKKGSAPSDTPSGAGRFPTVALIMTYNKRNSHKNVNYTADVKKDLTIVRFARIIIHEVVCPCADTVKYGTPSANSDPMPATGDRVKISTEGEIS